MANAEIRAKLAFNGVKQYLLAEALGITETALSRKLRKELPEEEKSRISSLIDEMTGKASTNV